MGERNLSSVQQTTSGSYIVVPPKALMNALGISKGDEVEWSLKGGEMVMKKVDDRGCICDGETKCFTHTALERGQ